MILTTNERNIDTNVDQSQVFKIKTTAQAFKILSSNLYSNKIRAIVRELSCNAIDAHKMAKNPNQFVVHLPNDFEPYFSVKDFGTGLSETDVFELYTSYFESTKSQSNDFIGALGLGSKSPFSYVDSFTIESIYEGEKKDYSAYISETGVPTISLLNTIHCSDHNGLEVKIPVDDSDYRKFKQEAEIVFYAFPQTPTIIGVKDFIDYKEFEKTESLMTHSGKGWRFLRSMPRSISNGPYASQGSINYPINTDIIIENCDNEIMQNKVYFVLHNNIIIDFPLGSLDIAASREEVSYDTKTIKTIKSRIIEIYDEFVKDFTNEINNRSLYNAINYYRSNIMYGVNNGRRLSFTHTATNTLITPDSCFYAITPIDFYLAKDSDNSPYGIRLSHHPIVGETKLSIYPNTKDILFIVEDEEIKNLKFREKLRVAITKNNMHLPVQIFIVKPENIGLFVENIGNPDFELLSGIEIPVEPLVKKTPKPRQVECNFSRANSQHREFEQSYFDIQKDFDQYYVVCQDNETIRWRSGKQHYRRDGEDNLIGGYEFKHFLESLESLGMLPKNINFYFVRKRETGYKRFEADTHLKRFDDFIAKHLLEYVNSHETRFRNLFLIQKKISLFSSFDIIRETMNASSNRSKKSNFNDLFWSQIDSNSLLKKAYLMIDHRKTNSTASVVTTLLNNDALPVVVKSKFAEILATLPTDDEIIGNYAMFKWIDFSRNNSDLEKRLVACREYVNKLTKEVI
jgi:hypothetical protein